MSSYENSDCNGLGERMGRLKKQWKEVVEWMDAQDGNYAAKPG